ncbi:putative F-box/FBD/LRR-repeat protein At4g03220 [Corylus avellana]|uniref:putative F-box/FBD/LRR-repeat protein At4g03220 n=1 Tax=Corylus avellana TaxID=13451 RepID=UPI00286D0787|nr:putative F-box/FBD/LRR-repeat protein At4g03220 [Corylus avellana]
METRKSIRRRKPLLKEEAAVETCRASKRKKLLLKEAVEDKEDRLSNLPDGILHHILSLLPVKSIAKTSVLSTRWNYLWATVPCLDFSEFSMKEKRRERKREAMELIIKTVLAARHANFNIKVFRFKGQLGVTCLGDWIQQLVRHSVEELELDVVFGGRFNLPPCLFDCDSLKSLTLKTHHLNSWFQFCSYDFTRTGRGLRSLQTLILKHVRFIYNTSAALFSASSFPALKRLTLNNCIEINRLNIGCPELEGLQVERTKMNVLEISAGEKLKNLRVISSFRASKNESWVKIFAPKLETFCWENNEFPEEYSVQSFTFLKKCSICITSSCGYRSNINAAKINHAISFLSSLVSTQKLYINITNLCAAKYC